MLSSEEIKLTTKRNYRRMRELIRISYGIGVNIEAPTRLRESLRILNVLLLISCTAHLYGQWCYIRTYLHDIPKVSEAICTALQDVVSMIKMIYFLFTQRKFAKLLNVAKTHEFLQRIEIFHEDFPNKRQLKKEINRIMENNWKNIRFQLIFYTICCAGIISNYFAYGMGTNLYHYFKGTPNYKPMLLVPAIFTEWEKKGMTFPYHHLLMLFGTSGLYVGGMGAVTFDGVFIVLCLHAVSQTQVLKVLIQQSTSPVVPRRKRIRYLRHCISHYQRVYSYLLEIRQIYKHITITQFLISLVVLGIVLFELTVGWESDSLTLIRMSFFIAAAGYEAFIFCFNGQLLTNALEEIPLTLYSCEWYNESKEFKKLLQMMIMRTNPEFCFQISWFAPMSMPTLMALIKTSGSYFLLLRKLYE